MQTFQEIFSKSTNSFGVEFERGKTLLFINACLCMFYFGFMMSFLRVDLFRTSCVNFDFISEIRCRARSGESQLYLEPSHCISSNIIMAGQPTPPQGTPPPLK